MARDLDFSRRRRPSVTASTVPPTKTVAKPIQPINSTTKLAWLWILIIILVALGTWALWQYFKPVSVAKTATPAPSITSEIDSKLGGENKSLLTPQSSTPTVQIYDSGAGADKVKTLQEKLKTLGYSAENLDNSQFNYDKTYVWYRTGLKAEAEKIGSTMPERQVTLKETKISGTFDILILLGTN
ncbi:MAG: LytR C-terminal domain-containing protein [Patescibacteria group bacterium]